MTEATATFDVRGHGPAGVVDIRGDVTAASEDVLMDAYDGAGDARGDRPQLHRARLHEQRWHRPAGDAAGARQPAVASGCWPSGSRDHYRQIFELTRLDEAIGIHDTEQDALAAAGAV